MLYTQPYLKLIPESRPAQARVSYASGYMAYQSGKLKTYSCDQIFQAVEGKFYNDEEVWGKSR